MTYREFVAYAQQHVRNVGRSFTEPDDDWPPMFIAEMRGGRGAVGLLPLEAFASDDTKDVLAEVVLPAIIERFKATKFAFTTSAWLSIVGHRPDVQAAQMEGRMRPSEDPERIEIVTLTCYDAERHDWFGARIHRTRRRPPKLGPFQEAHEIIGGERRPDWNVDGRFVDPIVQALR